MSVDTYLGTRRIGLPDGGEAVIRVVSVSGHYEGFLVKANGRTYNKSVAYIDDEGGKPEAARRCLEKTESKVYDMFGFSGG